MKIKSGHIRASAKGEQCTLQIAGVCNHDPATTVLAHLPDESNGMGIKSSDHSSCFACSACHACIDGYWANMGETGRCYRAAADFYMRRAMVRTWRRLIELGVVTIKGMK